MPKLFQSFGNFNVFWTKSFSKHPFILPNLRSYRITWFLLGKMLNYKMGNHLHEAYEIGNDYERWTNSELRAIWYEFYLLFPDYICILWLFFAFLKMRFLGNFFMLQSCLCFYVHQLFVYSYLIRHKKHCDWNWNADTF